MDIIMLLVIQYNRYFLNQDSEKLTTITLV